MNSIIHPHKRPTVLIVEDEQYVRESLTAYLDDIGFLVLPAENGRQGEHSFSMKSVTCQPGHR